tara:strand:+ start:2218 stop:2646 length:429 start_codon:yes stop_codon:yes gene_type:complete
MDSATITMDNYIEALADAFEKQVNVETFKYIAIGVLDKWAREQWELERNPYLSEDGAVPDTKAKKKKRKRDTTPLEKEDFVAKFKEDPTKIQRKLLVKAAGKNGWNVSKNFPVKEGAKKSLIIGLPNTELIEELKRNIPELN